MKKKILTLLICLMLTFSAFAFNVSAQDIPDTRQCPRVVDDADLLSDSEEEALLWLLDTESESNQFDIVIHTTDSIGGDAIETYADDYFDYNGFGYGENGDGIVLVVAMDIREYYMSTCGSGISLFTYNNISYCEDAFVPYLSSGDYHLAFTEFLGSVTDILTGEHNYDYDYDYGYDYDYDYNYGYDDGFKLYMDVPEMLGVSLVVGFIIAIVIACIHASKLKSVKSQRSAVNYVKEGSFVLSQSSDRFLYRHVSRRARPKQSSSGGRGGARMGSSGRSHGGGGGRF